MFPTGLGVEVRSFCYKSTHLNCMKPLFSSLSKSYIISTYNLLREVFLRLGKVGIVGVFVKFNTSVLGTDVPTARLVDASNRGVRSLLFYNLDYDFRRVSKRSKIIVLGVGAPLHGRDFSK